MSAGRFHRLQAVLLFAVGRTMGFYSARAWLVLVVAVLAGCGREEASSESLPQPASYVETIRGTDIRFDMVWVPEGRFWMGRTEVTWDEFLAYCDFEETGAAPPGVDAVTRPSKPLEDVAPYDRDWGVGKRPAVGMSWNAAKKYCKWLSLNTGRTYRLPSEAEWELALGNEPPAPLGEHCWHRGNSQGMTQEVGRKLPNENGLHDMLGNLWEYCRDPFSPQEPERAALRGGAWRTRAEAVSPASRLGFEEAWNMADPNVPPGVWWIPDGDHLGFRVLRPAEEKPR